MNVSFLTLWQDHFVCRRESISVRFGKTYKNFVEHEWPQIGMTLYKGKRVIVDGHSRAMLKMEDYRYVDQFDKSAFQVVVGERAPCTRYPAYPNVKRVKVANKLIPKELI